MSWMLPLPVVVPLLAAAVVVAGDRLLPGRLLDAVGIGAAASVCALGIALMLVSERGGAVQWFGGWRPHAGLAIGIAFVDDPFGAGMIALAGAIVCVALLYSLTYLTEAARLFDTLMLVCLGALCGFAVSGDLFNLFVWLELAGVAAYALTGFEMRDIGPLQGSVNFAITNTLGGYLVLTGLALTYARTGALNLAQIGRALAGHRPDGLVVVAFTLIAAGFLCKAAVVPFHFWLADAYAVAPAPVCAVFAGVMTDIGLLGVARVYWTAFSAAGLHIGGLLVVLGVVSALLGGTMAYLQRHLKRMLAYSVVCHIGIMLAGIGLLSPRGVAGAADMLLAHGLATAGLFLAVGVVVARLRSVDELHLHGRAAGMHALAVVWTLGALALVGVPYLGDYLGHAEIDAAANAAGRAWAPPFLWIAGALASAALLRAGARIFLGAGRRHDPLLSPEMKETPPRRGTRTRPLLAGSGLLVGLAALVSVVPGLASRSEYGGERLVGRAAYAAHVLDGVPVARVPRLPFSLEAASGESVLYGLGATFLAALLAWIGLYRPLRIPVGGLKALHSGVVGDYVMWVVVGTALLGGVWAVTMR